jgi:hypothetical protein
MGTVVQIDEHLSELLDQLGPLRQKVDEFRPTQCRIRVPNQTRPKPSAYSWQAMEGAKPTMLINSEIVNFGGAMTARTLSTLARRWEGVCFRPPYGLAGRPQTGASKCPHICKLVGLERTDS